jgi:ribonuclease-3
VNVEGLPAGVGKGYSKKESQQNAAEIALSQIEDADFMKSVNDVIEAKKMAADEQQPISFEDSQESSAEQPEQ